MDLRQMDPREYWHLLGGGEPVRQEEIPDRTGVLDPGKRTILIGVGGQGVQALNRIRKHIRAMHLPNERGYLRFLALDTDAYDLDRADALEEGEKLYAPCPGMQQMLSMSPECWPREWQRLLDREKAQQLGPVDGEGAGQNPLLGKLKFYYREPGTRGMWEYFLRMVSRSAECMEQVSQLDTWQVIVIAGICGGTGSGILPELPGLIRRILGPEQMQFYAMVYLPELTVWRYPIGRAALEANAGKTLQELEAGCVSGDGYDRVCLVNAPEWVEKPWESAEEMVVNHVLGAVLTGINGNDLLCPGYGAMGENDPFRFQGIRSAGVGDVAEELCRAYCANRLHRSSRCDRDQGLPDEMEQLKQTERLYNLMLNGGASFPVSEFRYEQVVFERIPDRRAFLEGTVDDFRVQGQVRQWIEQEMHQAREKAETLVRNAFQEYRKNVMNDVRAYGPRRFCSRYTGIHTPLRGTTVPGIRDRLEWIANDANYVDGEPNYHPDPKQLMHEKNQMTEDIRSQMRNTIWIHPFTEAIRKWKELYNQAVNEEIRSRIRGMLLGKGKLLDRHFVKPAEELYEQIRCFAHIMDAMSDIYGEQAARMNDYLLLSAWRNRENEICPAGISRELYNQTKAMLQNRIPEFGAQAFRNALVEDFFAHTEEWLAVEESGCGQKPPANARRMFDACLRRQVQTDAISLETLLENTAMNDPQLQEAVRTMLAMLLERNRGEYYRNSIGGSEHIHLVYPEDYRRKFPALVNALHAQSGAQRVFIHIHAAPTDRIRMYRTVAGLPSHALQRRI